MRNLIAIASILAMVILLGGGCGSSEVTTKDAEQQKKEFSKDSMEEAMRKAGKGAEWEEHKRKEEEFAKGTAGR